MLGSGPIFDQSPASIITVAQKKVNGEQQKNLFNMQEWKNMTAACANKESIFTTEPADHT